MPTIVLILCLFAAGSFGQSFTLRDVAFIGKIATPPVSGGVSWSPTNNPDGVNPKLWINANDVSGTINLWGDRTTNGNTFSSSPSGKPTVQSNANGTNNAVWFNGTQWIINTNFISSQPVEAVFVLSLTNAGANKNIFDGTNTFFEVIYDTSKLYGYAGTLSTGTLYPSNQWMCLDVIMANPVQMWTNNTSASLNLGTPGAGDCRGIVLGANHSLSANGILLIAEAFFLTATNTTAQRTSFYTNYLKPTWGLP